MPEVLEIGFAEEAFVATLACELATLGVTPLAGIRG
ncbi:hypothetical protein ACVIWU_006478 [Bradyrhizobium sp. USDA 4509]